MLLDHHEVKCRELNRGLFKPRTVNHSLHEGIVKCSNIYFRTNEVVEHFNNKNITNVEEHCIALRKAVGSFMQDRSVYLSRGVSIRADGLVIDDGNIKAVSIEVGNVIDVFELVPVEGKFFIKGPSYLKGTVKYIDPRSF